MSNHAHRRPTKAALQRNHLIGNNAPPRQRFKLRPTILTWHAHGQRHNAVFGSPQEATNFRDSLAAGGAEIIRMANHDGSKVNAVEPIPAGHRPITFAVPEPSDTPRFLPLDDGEDTAPDISYEPAPELLEGMPAKVARYQEIEVRRLLEEHDGDLTDEQVDDLLSDVLSDEERKNLRTHLAKMRRFGERYSTNATTISHAPPLTLDEAAAAVTVFDTEWSVKLGIDLSGVEVGQCTHDGIQVIISDDGHGNLVDIGPLVSPPSDEFPVLTAPALSVDEVEELREVQNEVAGLRPLFDSITRRTELEESNTTHLRTLARQHSVKGARIMRKEALVEAILSAEGHQ